MGVIDKVVWCVPEGAVFTWQYWDDAWVLYDSRSGDTQVLNEFAREALACFEDKPLSVGEICDEFSKIFEKPLSDGLRQELVNIIENFDRKGLISPL